jgi:hypothetical protein
MNLLLSSLAFLPPVLRRTEDQIDHFTIGRKWRRSLLDAMRGADVVSGHHLVIASLKIKLKSYRDQAETPSFKYNVHSLKDSVKSTKPSDSN